MKNLEEKSFFKEQEVNENNLTEFVTFFFDEKTKHFIGTYDQTNTIKVEVNGKFEVLCSVPWWDKKRFTLFPAVEGAAKFSLTASKVFVKMADKRYWQTRNDFFKEKKSLKDSIKEKDKLIKALKSGFKNISQYEKAKQKKKYEAKIARLQKEEGISRAQAIYKLNHVDILLTANYYYGYGANTKTLPGHKKYLVVKNVPVSKRNDLRVGGVEHLTDMGKAIGKAMGVFWAQGSRDSGYDLHGAGEYTGKELPKKTKFISYRKLKQMA